MVTRPAASGAGSRRATATAAERGAPVDGGLMMALAALIISLFALSWQLYESLMVDRARLKVEVISGLIAGGSQPLAVIQVTATNVGKRPTQLNGLWVAFGRPQTRWWHLRKRLWPRPAPRQQAIVLPSGGERALLSTTLPTQLGVGDSAHVLYDRVHVKNGVQQGYSHYFGMATASTMSATTHAQPLRQLDG